VSSGQPSVANGHRADENHVSRTSVERVSSREPHSAHACGPVRQVGGEDLGEPVEVSSPRPIHRLAHHRHAGLEVPEPRRAFELLVALRQDPSDLVDVPRPHAPPIGLLGVPLFEPGADEPFLVSDVAQQRLHRDTGAVGYGLQRDVVVGQLHEQRVGGVEDALLGLQRLFASEPHRVLPRCPLLVCVQLT